MTTRTKHVSESLAFAFGEQHYCMNLQLLDANHALNLFLYATGSSQDQVDSSKLEIVRAITKSMGSLPLALDQAASLTREPGYDLDRILGIYQSEQIDEVCQVAEFA